MRPGFVRRMAANRNSWWVCSCKVRKKTKVRKKKKENEAGRGQSANSKERVKEEGCVSRRYWRHHAQFRTKAIGAASNTALLVFEQQTVPWPVQQEVQRAAQRDAQRAALASAAPATEVAPAESCAEGVAAAAALANMALYETASRLTASGATPPADSALKRAHELLSPPVVTRGIAQAYDNIRAMRRDLPFDCEETGKVAWLAVREALVLQICCTAGLLSAVEFERELGQAFGRTPRPEVRSQLHRTRAGICRLGRDRDNFMRSAPKIFDGALGDQQLTELYQAYAKCANGSSLAFASGGGCRG